MEFSREEFNKEFDIYGISEENEKYATYLHEKTERKYREETKDRDILKEKLKSATDEELMIYIPDVYQKSIYDINYIYLMKKGIRLLTFDIDDTIDDSVYNKARGIMPGVKVKMPEEARKLFRLLKEMGFYVALLTNAGDFVAKDVCEDLQADDYISDSRKPQTTAFEEMMRRFDVKPSEAAHIGNSMRDDVVGGNRAGVVTCLVRRNGYTIKVGKKMQNLFGKETKGQLIRKELIKRDLWRKHHKYEKNDQYYQLDEKPEYRTALKDNKKEKTARDIFLEKNYKPDVYQHDIFDIDYIKLKEKGIKLLSFDVDDTIAGLATMSPSKEAVSLFVYLRNMGFEIELMSNNFSKDRIKHFAKELGISENCIYKAKKPLDNSFEILLKKHCCTKEQMAHIGNSMMDDVAGANGAGVTSCLVRRAGIIGGVGKKLLPGKTHGQRIRDEMLERDIWRKHHKYEKGDQYYQIDEEPLYRTYGSK